jgi:hypothetical protein
MRSAFAVRSSAIGSSRPAEFVPAAVDPAFRTGAWASSLGIPENKVLATVRSSS